jgi:drug/metabolite transporter (DMT)-like permease
VALLVYAVAFSFAFLDLATGTGALLLFGSVQATMVLAGLRAGERPPLREWVGTGLALAGLVVLVAPGLDAPSPLGSALMVVAGVGWGVYSLRGRGSTDPVADTTGNFLRLAPVVVVLGPIALLAGHASARGALLAVGAGAVTTGLGYVVWYVALRGLSATRAATVQLAVPVIAAGLGVAVLGEAITLRFVVAAVVTLGGVRLAVGPARGQVG